MSSEPHLPVRDWAITNQQTSRVERTGFGSTTYREGENAANFEWSLELGYHIQVPKPAQWDQAYPWAAGPERRQQVLERIAEHFIIEDDTPQKWTFHDKGDYLSIIKLSDDWENLSDMSRALKRRYPGEATDSENIKDQAKGLFMDLVRSIIPDSLSERRPPSSSPDRSPPPLKALTEAFDRARQGSVAGDVIQSVYRQFLSITLNLEAWGSVRDRIQIAAVIVDAFALDRQVLGVYLCDARDANAPTRLELVIVIPAELDDAHQVMHQSRLDERGGLPSHVTYRYSTPDDLPPCDGIRQIVYDRDGNLSAAAPN